MNQHLVSRVVLRRWANGDDAQISGLDLDSLKQRTGSVDSFGAVKDLITKDPDVLEQTWQNQVEQKLEHPLRLVEAGEIFGPKNGVYVEVLKECIALHWARSFTIVTMMKSIQPKYVDQVTWNVLSQYTGTRALEALTGLSIPEPIASHVFHQKVSERFDQAFSEEMLAAEFEKNRRRARQLIGDKGLEIGTAGASEFVIGDCPVVTVVKGCDKGGPLNGVAWGDADAIFMPIGSHHVIALSKESRYRELSEGQVVTLNRLQIQAAYKEHNFRPGSGLGDRIAEALEESSTPPTE